MTLNLPEGYAQYTQEWEAKINAFIELDLEGAAAGGGKQAPSIPIPQEAAALVKGFPFAVKDNIAVKNLLFTCGSKLLRNFRSPYSAAAVQKLEEAGGVVIGKTNLDEFAMGFSTDNSAIKQTNNPWDLTRVPGGSSGGSAAAVAAGIVPYALGTDTGGSVRQPAAFCGVVGLKPTYGAVSRFGLAAYASCFDTAGILADTIDRCRAVFAIIRGKDSRDETSLEAPKAAPPLYPAAVGGKKKIGMLSPKTINEALIASLKESNGDTLQYEAAAALLLEDEVSRSFELAKERFAAMGHSLVDVEIPLIKYACAAFLAIAAADASGNMARYDGIRYGERPAWAEDPDELVNKVRTEGFGPEVKLHILLGTYVLRSGIKEHYYLQAEKIKSGIKKSFESYLGDGEYKEQAKLDAILMPVFPCRAFGREKLSPFVQKAFNIYTCCANLAGLPALAFPASLEGGLPTGVQLLGRAWSEGTLFDIAQGYERQFQFPHPAGFKDFWS